MVNLVPPTIVDGIVLTALSVWLLMPVLVIVEFMSMAAKKSGSAA